VPVLVVGQGTGELGLVAFADVASLIAAHLGVPVPNKTGVVQ
jgi:hypothetical protein